MMTLRWQHQADGPRGALLHHASLLVVLRADMLLRGTCWGVTLMCWSSSWSFDSFAATRICCRKPPQTSVIFVFRFLRHVICVTAIRVSAQYFRKPHFFLGMSATPAEMRERLIEKLRLVLSSGSDEECSVCLDSIRLPVITHCAHVYCRPCITQVISKEQVYGFKQMCCPQKKKEMNLFLCLGESPLSPLQGWDQD